MESVGCVFRFMHMYICENNKEKESINLRRSGDMGKIGMGRHGEG